MIIKRGNLFTSDAEALGHGVNIRGLMGAGIAKQFKDNYEDNYLFYTGQCATGQLKPGGCLIVPAMEKNYLDGFDVEQRLIVNIASQDEPGANARYDWLFDGARAAAESLIALGVDRCAIPQIGAGIGGLVWERVERILHVIEDVVPGFEWEVWIYDPTV